MNILWLSLGAFLMGAQAVMGVYAMGQAFHALGISPLFLYGLFIAVTFLSQGFLIAIFWGRISQHDPSRQAYIFLTVEAVLVFLMVSALFKTVIYDNSPQLAWACFWVVMAAAVIHKLFTIEVYAVSRQALALAHQLISRCPSLVKDGVVVVAIALIVYIPDAQKIVALSFIGEQLHHFDYFVMSPGLSILYGGVPYVDVMSQYGVGLPWLLTHAAKILGGFDYTHTLTIMLVITVAYFQMLYLFLLRLTYSRLIALAGFLVCFRTQMFHFGVSPLVWIYPSATPLRFFLDVIFFMMILEYSRQGKNVFLVLAGCLAGMTVFLMTSTGLFLAAAFYAVLAMVWLRDRRPKPLGWIAACPIVVAGGCFLATIGSHVMDGIFWKHLVEYIRYFSAGHAGGVLPIYESLKYRNYFTFAMGMIIALSYTFTLLVAGAGWFQRRLNHEYLAVAAMCVYGLGAYTYFVVRSAQTSYYVVAMPFFWLCCFGLKVAIEKVAPRKASLIAWGAVLISAYALATNHNYLTYPNIINVSQNPLVDPKVIQRFPDRQGYFNHQVKGAKEDIKLAVNSLGQVDEDVRTEDDFKTDEDVKAYYRQESVFTEDAALIDRWVPPDSPAALISSFETAMLLQAKRKPFFYHIPLLTSRPLKARFLPNDAAHSPNFLEETIAQMERAKPAHIFIEKILWSEGIPSSYQQSHANVLALIAYVKAHYMPIDQGRFLMALQRKE